MGFIQNISTLQNLREQVKDQLRSFYVRHFKIYFYELKNVAVT